ncbi:exonuclease domain-containing protein [Bacillus tianshenii]|nr:exonuclease domain-containing protein [Bacillus tianshenii]
MEKIGCLVDVETTGLSPERDEIIEMALILFSYDEQNGSINNIIEKYSALREPLSPTAKENYDEAYRVHGIPFNKVKGKQFDDHYINKLFEQADILIAHNASFDRSFIYRMYPEVNEKKWHCSMRHVKWQDYGFENKKLITLLQGHSISNHQTHRALDDILNLLELLKLQSPNEEIYFKEVISNKPMRKYQPRKKQKYQPAKGYTISIGGTNSTEPQKPKHHKQWENPIVRFFYSKPVLILFFSFMVISNLFISLVYGLVYFIISFIIIFLFYKGLTNKRKEMLEYKRSNTDVS